MVSGTGLQHRIDMRADGLSRSELHVARYFAANREEVLVASAVELATKTGTSDATVIRTARALDYAGLDELRRALAAELRGAPTPAARVAGSLKQVRGDVDKALRSTLDLHVRSIKKLRRNITPDMFRATVDYLVRAERIAIFGIGPSSAMANYFAIQGRRFGLDVVPLTDTGLLLADGLLRLRRGDLLIVMAYGRVYPELEALFDRADQLGLSRLLMTDTLGPKLTKRTNLVLEIPRGRSNAFSMHATTLAFIETLLIGIATQRPKETLQQLSTLNQLRSKVTGKALDL